MEKWIICNSLSSLFLRVCSLDDIEVQMADWWDRISITLNNLADLISLIFTACLWHVARAVASFDPVHYGARATCHVNAKCEFLALLWKMSVTQMRLVNWKKPAVFDYCFEWPYLFVWARADCSSPRKCCLSRSSPFDEMFKRAYTVKHPSRSSFFRVLKTFAN